MQPDFPRINASQVLFYEFELHCLPQSCRKAYKMTESRSSVQISTINNLQANVRQYTCMYQHHSRDHHQWYRQVLEMTSYTCGKHEVGTK